MSITFCTIFSMKFLKEFKEFAVKGNMIDMAIGIIIGASFNKVIDVLVKKVFLPPLSLMTNGLNYENKRYILREAVKSYDRAIEIKPDRYEIWTGRAWALYKLRKYEESNENYNKVLQLNPDFQAAKHNQEIIQKKLAESKR